jgi:copper transport protein
MRRFAGWPSSRLWRCCVVLLLLLFAEHPTAARAHASLLSSSPANDAVLVAAPTAFTLAFNEAVTPLVMRIIDQHGVAGQLSQIEQRGSNLVMMAPNGMLPGAYVLSWRVISADGHPVGGSLTFWIGARSSPAPSVVDTESMAVRVAIWMTRLVIYVGLFVGAGGAFFLAWIGRNQPMRGARRVVAAATLAGILGLLVSIGFQGLDALAAPLSALALSAVWSTGAHGSFGWSVLIAGLSLFAGLLSLRLRRPLSRPMSAAALLGVGVALSASGHAATADPRIVAMVAVIAHGTALAFWIGALVPLAFVLCRGDEAIGPLKAFSFAAPFAVALLLASGLTLSVIQLQHLAALWTTDYGRVLIAKLSLVGLLLLLALWNRSVLTPGVLVGQALSQRRMRTSIAVEVVLIVAVLGVVGLWRFTPPPRLLAASVDNFFLHVHTERAMANVTISPGSAGPVEIDVQLETPSEQLLNAMELSVTLSNPDLGIEPTTAQARRISDGQWHVSMTAPVAGRWMLGLGILISDFDKVNVEAPILIK